MSLTTSKIFPGKLRREIGLSLFMSVGEPFLNMGLTHDNFLPKGKVASLALFLKIGNRQWITESPTREWSVGDTWSGSVAFLGLAAFISLFFMNSQLMSVLPLVGVTLVIKLFKDDKSKGSSCLVRSFLIHRKVI